MGLGINIKLGGYGTVTQASEKPPVEETPDPSPAPAPAEPPPEDPKE